MISSAILLQAGFSAGSGHSEGIYAVVPFAWDESPSFKKRYAGTQVIRKTDPWEWRIRVIEG